VNAQERGTDENTAVVPTSCRRKRKFLSERTTGPSDDGRLSVLK